MKDKIKIEEKTKDGWPIAVSADITCKFLEFCRSKKLSVNVDVGIVSGGGVPDTDYFNFDSKIEKHRIEQLVKEFIG